MMRFLSVLILAISSNLDVLTIGFAYGIKKVLLRFMPLFIISFITFIGTFISMVLGGLITNIIPKGLPNIIGGFIIIIIGCFGLISCLVNRYKNEEKEVKELSIKQIIILGSILAINNFAIGIGSSIAGFNIILTSFSSFFVCLFFLYLGNRIGNFILFKNVGLLTEVLSNIIMIMLGIFNLL